MIMKKIYNSPETKIVKVTMKYMIAQASLGNFKQENGKKGTVLSREGGNFWNDDEENW